MRSWLPTLSIAFAAFIFVTSEFIPVGLLPEIAHGFNRTEGETGIMMTIYAWIVAGLSMPLTAYVSHINRRKLMLWLMGIFALAHILTVLAWNFEWLMVSRTFVAIAHAIYWAVAIPLGIRLAPNGKRTQAMSIVATGATLGSLLGIPIGTYLGQIFGWRLSFGVIGLCAALVGIVLYACLPHDIVGPKGNFKTIGMLFKRRQLVIVYIITFITMTGHYAAFTFITPFLQQIGHIASDRIASVLLMYGVAGLVSGWIAPFFLGERFPASAIGSLLIVGASLAIFRATAESYLGVLALVLIWGSAFLIFNLILQNLVLAMAPDAEDVAMAGYSGIYNMGIGGGALIGSLSASHELGSIGYIGAACVFASFGIYVRLIGKLTPKDSMLDPRLELRLTEKVFDNSAR